MGDYGWSSHQPISVNPWEQKARTAGVSIPTPLPRSSEVTFGFPLGNVFICSGLGRALPAGLVGTFSSEPQDLSLGRSNIANT